MTIRRSSDSSQLDFYADANGNLGDALNGTGGSLTTWLGDGNTGYVTKWYDQSGNSKHATQTNTLYQPAVNQSNKYVDFQNSSNSYLELADSSLPTGSTAYTITWRQGTLNSSPCIVFWQGAQNQYNALYTYRNSTIILHSWWLPDWSVSDSSSLSASTSTYNCASGTNPAISYYKNGSSYASTTLSGTRATLSTNGRLGSGNAGGNPINGPLYFFVSFNTSLSTSDRTIEEQLNGY